MYDGSDYGPESDDDGDSSIPPILAKRIRDVELLVRLNLNAEDTLSENGGIVKRTAHALKDLGPQSSIENGVSRLITAYTSMTTHRTHKTRELFSQAHSLLYGGMLDLPLEVIEELLDEIDSLSSSLALPFQISQPQSSSSINPLQSLSHLSGQTSDLSQTLRSLSDVLTESRIHNSAAARKLKSVKEMVEEIRLEDELRETSIMLIQAGDWDRRCRERQAARTCREVVEDFADRWGLELDVGTVERPWMHDQQGSEPGVPVS